MTAVNKSSANRYLNLPIRADELLADYLTGVVTEAVKSLMVEIRNMNPLLSVADVAKTLNISERKVDDLIQEGEIPVLWIGGQKRVHPDNLKAFLYSENRKKGKRRP